MNQRYNLYHRSQIPSWNTCHSPYIQKWTIFGDWTIKSKYMKLIIICALIISIFWIYRTIVNIKNLFLSEDFNDIPNMKKKIKNKSKKKKKRKKKKKILNRTFTYDE